MPLPLAEASGVVKHRKKNVIVDAGGHCAGEPALGRRQRRARREGAIVQYSTKLPVCGHIQDTLDDNKPSIAPAKTANAGIHGGEPA